MDRPKCISCVRRPSILRAFATCVVILVCLMVYIATYYTPYQNFNIGTPAHYTYQWLGIDSKETNAWHQIPAYTVIERFKPKTSRDCIKRTTPLVCPQAILDINQTDGAVNVKGCQTSVSLDALSNAVTSTKLIIPLFADNEYILPWEGPVLKEGPLRDSKLLPNLTRSRVVSVTPVAPGSVVSCSVGETIQLRADLIDSYGNHRLKGMDDVRAWVVQGNVKKTGFAANTQVIDLRNGSYLIRAVCLWPGKSQLRVGVAYPREYIRTVADQHRLHTGRSISARFANSGFVSMTACSATPNLPYSCICNFTDWNKQSFYCGHPAHPNLTCDDVLSLAPLWFHQPVNVTDAERELNKRMTKQAVDCLIADTIHIHVNKGSPLQTSRTCSDMPLSVTWDHPRPLGYWGPGLKWTSLLCHNPSVVIRPEMPCLHNTTVWVLGDSNAGVIYTLFVKLTKCKPIDGNWWPFKCDCLNTVTNSTVHFYPHEYPLYLHGDRWNPINRYGGVAGIIDSVPSHGRHLIVAHYYLHAAGFHMSTSRAKLISLRDAVDRLIQRNPDARVAFRGPHVIYRSLDANHAAGGDVLISHYLDMVKELFRPLRDHVIFLDGVDMTVALENEPIHPVLDVPRELVNLFLSSVCVRPKGSV